MLAQLNRTAASLLIVMLVVALAVAACSPMAPDVAAPPTLTPIPTTTPTSTPTPTATGTQTATPVPTLMRTPVPPTAAPTTGPIVGQPVSRYAVPISGKVTAAGGTLTLRRVEFWQELTRLAPHNGLFVVFIGELASASTQIDCSKSDEFALTVDGRKFDTSSTLMEPFKILYKTNYPGSFLGQCATKPDATFLVFDTPVQLGAAKLMYRGVALDLGDLIGALRKSGYPLPAMDSQLKAAVEKALGPHPRSPSRVLDLKAADAPQPPGAKNITVSWVFEDSEDAAKNKDNAKGDATTIFRAVFTAAGLSVAQVEVAGTFRTFDVFGNPADTVVARLTLDKATADKINWTNFQPRNIFAVAKVVFLDPKFKD